MIECMTGREFCDLIEINYDNIVEIRKRDQLENLHTFVTDLLRIPDLKAMITRLNVPRGTEND